MNEGKFDYTYCAPTEEERREIESIKRQYQPSQKGQSKLEELRDLNKKVTQPPFIFALASGISGTLIAGLGMTMVLEWNIMLWGSLVGVLGIAAAAAAYPVYKLLLRRRKQKYGQRIIDLSNELLGNAETL